MCIITRKELVVHVSYDNACLVLSAGRNWKRQNDKFASVKFLFQSSRSAPIKLHAADQLASFRQRFRNNAHVCVYFNKNLRILTAYGIQKLPGQHSRAAVISMLMFINRCLRVPGRLEEISRTLAARQRRRRKGTEGVRERSSVL